MGGSKVVLVGATSLIVGIYSLSLKRVESDYVKASSNRVKVVQLDRLAEATLRLAVNDLANGWSARSVSGKKALGGSTDYAISKNGTTFTITATVKVGGATKTIVATALKTTGTIKKSFRSIHRGQYVVTKYYVKNG